ncbi:MAG TPA: DUF4932 domain-containing protein [Kofleriaceae bacterium]
MRWILVASFAVACSSKAPPPVAAARARNVHVDRRVELLAIIMRLTGTPEYQRAQHTDYVNAVDAHFAKFRSHPAVQMAVQLRREHGIGYDAPIELATHLDAQLAPLNPDELLVLDKRWIGVDVTAYAKVLADFARDSDLDGFLAEHERYFADLESQLGEVLEKENPIPWLDATFGPAEVSFEIIPCPLAGTWNFATHTTKTFYQVLGVDSQDGNYHPSDMLTELIVHEMTHSYVNPAFQKFWPELEPAVTPLFERVREPMTKEAYGDPAIFLNETGVRAVVVAYLREKHGDAVANASVEDQKRRSFIGIAELAPVMTTGGPSLEARIPAIVATLEKL